MGFFDSKSSTSGAEGTVGSQTEAGSPSSVNIAAGDDLRSANVSITNELVDPGALALAEELSRSSVVVLSELGDATRELGAGAFAASRDVVDASVALAEDFGANAFSLGREAINDAADARVDSFALARDVSGEVTDLVSENQSFLADVFDLQTGLVDSVIGTVRDSSQRFLGAASDLVRRESANTEGRIEDITQRALLVGGGVLALALIVGGVVVARR